MPQHSGMEMSGLDVNIPNTDTSGVLDFCSKIIIVIF